MIRGGGRVDDAGAHKYNGKAYNPKRQTDIEKNITDMLLARRTPNRRWQSRNRMEWVGSGAAVLYRSKFRGRTLRKCWNVFRIIFDGVAWLRDAIKYIIIYHKSDEAVDNGSETAYSCRPHTHTQNGPDKKRWMHEKLREDIIHYWSGVRHVGVRVCVCERKRA